MIELSHVNKVYSEGNRAVKDLSLTIDDGEFAFIVGRSGSGKSTLLKLLLRSLSLLPGGLWSMIWIWGRCPEDMFRNTGEN